MPYRIVSVKQEEETVTTEVEFTLSDGSVVKASVPHFAPQSQSDIEEGLANREATEETRLAMTRKAAEVAAQLKVGLGD